MLCSGRREPNATLGSPGTNSENPIYPRRNDTITKVIVQFFDIWSSDQPRPTKDVNNGTISTIVLSTLPGRGRQIYYPTSRSWESIYQVSSEELQLEIGPSGKL
jgi:hypothetical protein